MNKYYEIKANATQYISSTVSNQEAFRLAGYLGDDPLVELCISFFDEQYFGDNTMYHASLEWIYYQSAKMDRTVPEGYKTILQTIVDEAPSFGSKVKYNTKVINIDDSDYLGGAVVTYKRRVLQPTDITNPSALADEDSSDGCNDNNLDDDTKWVTHQVYAKDVICTAPLMVLRNNHITFNPPMPAPMRHAVNHLLTNVVGKVALFFDDGPGRTALK